MSLKLPQVCDLVLPEKLLENLVPWGRYKPLFQVKL